MRRRILGSAKSKALYPFEMWYTYLGVPFCLPVRGWHDWHLMHEWHAAMGNGRKVIRPPGSPLSEV